MRVAYISSTFVTGEPYGMGRYARALYDHLDADIPTIDMMPISLWRRARSDFAPLYDMRYNPLGHRTTLRVWRRLPFPPLEWLMPSFDVVHALEWESPLITHKPWVVTVHDIGPLTHHQFFSGSNQQVLHRSLTRVARYAAALICGSQATAQSIQDYLQLDLSAKIRIIYGGVDEGFFSEPTPAALDAVAAILPGDEPYFLVSSAASPRKNLVRVIEAFEQVADELPHHLVMTGRLHWDFEPLLAKLQQSRYAHRIHRMGHVSDEVLRALHRRASAHLYASLMEGFGLPIVEAMAGGCPVITSNNTSMPETAGGAACLVDPYDVHSIAAAMKKLVQDRSYAEDLRARGFARAKQLSWRESARRTAQVYQEVGG